MNKILTWGAVFFAAAAMIGAAEVRGGAKPFPACQDGETAERLADHDALVEAVPRLRVQRSWKDYGDQALVEQYLAPAIEWTLDPVGDYDLSGFDPATLGSAAPAPGVHPRLLFSPEDLPALREKVGGSRFGQKFLIERRISIDNTLGNSAHLLGALAAADPAQIHINFRDGLGSDGRINNTVITIGDKTFKEGRGAWDRNGYAMNLAGHAWYVILSGDEARGRLVSRAVVNYYKLVEQLLAYHFSRGDDPADPNSWPRDLWRGTHELVGLDYPGWIYEFLWPSMDDEQRAFMRGFIAKATQGMRAYGMNGPYRWRDTNWVSWDTHLLVNLAAIKGEQGFDEVAYKACRETVLAFMKYGISPTGTLFEVNGKAGAGLQHILINLVIMARNGDNHFGHPHWRRQFAYQAQILTPDKSTVFDQGTIPLVNYGDLFRWFAYFYPGDKIATYLAEPMPEQEAFDAAAYEEQLKGQKYNRNTYFRAYYIYDAIVAAHLEKASPATDVTRAELGLPADYHDPLHGLMVTRTSDEPDATHLWFEARHNLYARGHQHHSAGHFYFASHGRVWVLEHTANPAGSGHNQILIDGIGQGSWSGARGGPPVRVDWLGARVGEAGSQAVADIKRNYDYSWDNFAGQRLEDIKLSDDPRVIDLYKGTQNWKMRIWRDDYYSNPWSPPYQWEYNPVEYAFRTATLVKGKRPYAVIVDDIRKDGRRRLYEWAMWLAPGVEQVQPHRDLTKNRPAAASFFAYPDDIGGQQTLHKDKPALMVLPLVANVDVWNETDGVVPRLDRFLPRGGSGQQGHRLVYARNADDGRFQMLLFPYVQDGRQQPPQVTALMNDSGHLLSWDDEEHLLRYQVLEDSPRRLVSVDRISRTDVPLVFYADAERKQKGLRYAYYEEAFQMMPDWSLREPKKTGLMEGVSLEMADRGGGFGVVFEGYVDIPENGDYMLRLNAADAAEVQIGGEHMAATQGATLNVVKLQKEIHPVRIAYYNWRGGRLELTCARLTAEPLVAPLSETEKTSLVY